MSLLDNLSDKFRAELLNLAQSHPTFETFAQDVQRLAETTWHQVRTQGAADAAQAGQQLEGDVEGAVGQAASDANADLNLPTVKPGSQNAPAAS